MDATWPRMESNRQETFYERDSPCIFCAIQVRFVSQAAEWMGIQEVSSISCMIPWICIPSSNSYPHRFDFDTNVSSVCKRLNRTGPGKCKVDARVYLNSFLIVSSCFEANANARPHDLSSYTDCGSYYHQCFLRGKPQLTALMRMVPSGRGRVTPNTYEEPNFYNYSVPDQSPPGIEASAAADVPAEDNQTVLEVAAGLGFDEDDDQLALLTRKAAAPDTEKQSTSNSNQDEWDPFPFDHDHEVDFAAAHSNHREFECEAETEANAAPESATNQYAGSNAANNLCSMLFHCEICKESSNDGKCGQEQEYGWSYCERCWVYYCKDCKLGMEGIGAIQYCASCESNYCGKCRVSRWQGQGQGRNEQWCSPADCAGCIQIAAPLLLEENKKVRKENEEVKAENKQLKRQNGKGKGIEYDEELMLLKEEMKQLKEKMLEFEALDGKVVSLEDKLKSMAI